MKKQLVLLFLLITIKNHSQTAIYDYIVDNNKDTIVGIYENNEFTDLQKKRYKITSEIIKTIQHEGTVYTLSAQNKATLNDSILYLKVFPFLNNPLKSRKKIIYAHHLKEELITDYAITKENDTIFGHVSRAIFNSYKIIDAFGNKTQFGTKKIKEFRKDGYKYINKKKSKARR